MLFFIPPFKIDRKHPLTKTETCLLFLQINCVQKSDLKTFWKKTALYQKKISDIFITQPCKISNLKNKINNRSKTCPYSHEQNTFGARFCRPQGESAHYLEYKSFCNKPRVFVILQIGQSGVASAAQSFLTKK